MRSPVHYVAEPSDVREVSLRGTADLPFWRDRLAFEELVPAERDGKAQVLIVAASMKYMGIHFSEVSFSVLVLNPIPGTQKPAAFLVQAFNSCRPFAFCERVLFATPYLHAGCAVSVSSPVLFEVAIGGQVVCRAEMQAESLDTPRQDSRAGDDEWEGMVFLPRRPSSEGRLFFAKMSGYARACPFLPDQDQITIRPPPGTARLDALVASHFTAEEWLVRESGTHGKSKTYRRSGVRA